MEKNNLFDLHCDTLGVLYRSGREGCEIKTQLDIEKCAKSFRAYSQVFAVYSPDRLSPSEAWDNFIYTRDKISSHKFPENVTPYLSIEGGKLLDGKYERLDTIKNSGVCILTLVWGGICCVGGAHGTDTGFTDFGRDVLRYCLENGIVPDVSHASDKMFRETAEICKKYSKPFIASHSCSRAIRKHTRNLTDDMFKAVAESGGIVGISLAPSHLSASGNADAGDVARHIKHFLSLGYESAVALGCDYDGIETPPTGLESPERLAEFKTLLKANGISNGTADGIFYNNARAFFETNNIKPINA